MKKITVFIAALAFCGINAQNTNKINYIPGSGLDFGFHNDEYHFNIGGFVQPKYTYSKMDGEKAGHELNVNHAFFTLRGNAVKEKISFELQTDFSLSAPLLDAWVGYHPTENITIAAGQKKSPLNNREMTINEDRLTFAERSLLSTELSNTGREFGGFAEVRIGKGNFKIVPQVAVTSGDGRNSFGSNSRDTDLGGLKYGGRLDIYPLGFFKYQEYLATADVHHEDNFKMVIGSAYSYNKGVSESVGEGHGNFTFYDAQLKIMHPDYRKLYADILMKYRGFSLLGEYANATATKLDGSFIDDKATLMLQPQQISSYLVLGNSYNMQVGYVTRCGFGLDVRYTMLRPEFTDYQNSLMQNVNGYSVGLTKYFVGNSLKLHAAYSNYDWAVSGRESRADLMVQLIF